MADQANAVNNPAPVAVPNTKNNPTPVQPPEASAAPLNPQGLTAAQMASPQAPAMAATVQKSLEAPGTVQTGPTTGTTPNAPGQLPAIPTAFQAYTQPYQTNAQGQQIDQKGMQQTADYEKAQAAERAARQKQLDEANKIPVSSIYDPATGQWAAVPPAPNIQPLLSKTSQNLISGMFDGEGILSTSNYSAASASVGDAVQNGKNSLMSNNPAMTAMDQYTMGIIQHNQQEAARLQAFAYNPSADPMQQILAAKQSFLAQQKASQEQTIQTQADAQMKQQEKLNKQLEGSARAASNAAGQIGSMTGESYIAGQLQNNQDALNSIKAAEMDAIQRAETAYTQGEIELAGQQLQVAEQRRQQASDLNTQNVGLIQSYQAAQLQRQQAQQQAVLTQQQITANGRTAASDFLSVYAKQGLSVQAIPQQVWQQAVQDSGNSISVDTAKAIYQGGLVDQQAKTAEAFNTNTEAFYKAAASVKDPNAVLFRPNANGTFTSVKKSEVQSVPNYDTFQTTKNGKQYATYVNKEDPKATPVEVLLGNVDPKTTYKDDAFGNTLAIVDNGDGTFSSKKVLDFMGNPVGHQAITNTVSQLDASGTSYSQSSGAPAWAPPNGSIHTRGGQPATECGQYVNDTLKMVPHFGDSLQSKVAVCDPTIGTAQNPVAAGDAIVTNEAAGTGHVAVVASVGRDAKGTYYVLNESNYKKNAQGQGLVETGRKIYADSPAIQGFGRGQVNPAARQPDGPVAPGDNTMSWKISAPAGSPVMTVIKSGTVQDVTQVGSYKDGSPMFMATILDNETGTLTNYSGIKASELRVGSSWTSSETAPHVGVTGEGGHVVDLRNPDGSPIGPTGNTLSSQLAAGQSWGTLPMIPPTTYAQNKFNKVTTDLEKTGNLDAALSAMKNDPVLSQVMPSAYLDSLQASASVGKSMMEGRQAMTNTRNQRVATQKINELRVTNPGLFNQNFEKYVGSLDQYQSRMDQEVAQATSDDPNVRPFAQGSLLDSVIQIARGGGTQIPMSQIELMVGGRNLANKLQVKGNQLVGTGGEFTDAEVQGMYGLGQDIMAAQRQAYTKMKTNQAGFMDQQFPGQGLGQYVYQPGVGSAAPASQLSDLSYYQSQLQPGEQLYFDGTSYFGAPPDDPSVSGLTPVQ